MPYRTYALWVKPTAQCAECGAEVRLRGFWTLTGIGLLSLALLPIVLTLFPAARLGPGAVVLLSGILLAVDYGSYHVLSWESTLTLPSPESGLLPELDTGPGWPPSGGEDTA
jgi:hypothetical protein